MSPTPSGSKKSYRDLLEELKAWFPAPISNPVMDGYFVHAISRFLDRLDGLKSAAPVLGRKKERDYGKSLCEGSPEEMCSIEEVTELLVDYCQGMPIWAHPNAQDNVVPSASIPSIMAFMAASIYNPNMVSDEYSSRFSEAEIAAIAILSEMIGYDPQRSGGIFTFGGTGTSLYGCKLGIEKALKGNGMSDGIREEVKIVASEASHYTRLNIAGWLGVGTKNVITIPTTLNNDMSLGHLERYLRGAFERGEKVAVLLVTMGTTDAFGIDDLTSIVSLRNDLSLRYGLECPPHIHADAVIGWVWIVFKDYDFEMNPLAFGSRTLRSIRESLDRIKNLGLADSMGVDFHKTGYAPYVSSAFLCQDRQDLALLSREPDEMPYLYHFGRYKPGIYSLECSRPGTSALAALANLRLFGKQGYRVLIGHVVEMAEMLRERLESYPFIRVLNNYNYGPVTLFRVYPDQAGQPHLFERELTDAEYRRELLAHNDYNRRIFDLIHERAMRGEGILLSWTRAYRNAEYTGGPPVAALKSYIMSPWTDPKAIDMVVRQVLEARKSIPSLKE
ncbi:MAG: pyridoxal phosphate-dependent decarboxylase family protein [Deltaproteobacteria bacterium]